MEDLLQKLIEQQQKMIRLAKKQNKLIAELFAAPVPVDKETLKRSILDNTDLKNIFKIGDTKFFQIKKLFKTYRLDNKDYYLSDEVLKTIKANQSPEEPDTEQ